MDDSQGMDVGNGREEITEVRDCLRGRMAGMFMEQGFKVKGHKWENKQVHARAYGGSG